MNRAFALVAAGFGVLAAGSLAPAQAGPPAPFSRTVIFVDNTPDPTGYVLGPEHCSGRLPAEAPVPVNVPGPGTLDIAISGFTGEWSLLVTDKDGEVIATADADAPATESMTMRLKRAAKINILPCNLFGTNEAKLTYSYKYKK